MPEAQRRLFRYPAIILTLSTCLQVSGQEQGREPEAPVKRDPAAEKLQKTVVLPNHGSYRAPGILRLAGKLHGLPVKVEQRELNDEKIMISRQLAQRPVTLDELNLLLASQSFYLHVWNHPRHGKLLVVSRQKDWKPENLRFHRILKVGAREFDHAWITVQNTVAKLNAELDAGSSRIVTLASAKTGKIFLWAPRKDWLQEVIKEAEKSIAEAQTTRQHLNTYKARHLRAAKLKEAFLEEFPEEDLDQIHLTVAPWGNHLLYRASKKDATRVRDLLIKLDKLPDKVR